MLRSFEEAMGHYGFSLKLVSQILAGVLYSTRLLGFGCRRNLVPAHWIAKPMFDLCFADRI
jgi:hypothetical protein